MNYYVVLVNPRQKNKMTINLLFSKVKVEVYNTRPFTEKNSNLF